MIEHKDTLMNTDQVIADLAAQVDWYGKLLRLAELQHTLVEQERTDDLLVVLDRRQKIVEQLTAIEQRVRPLKLRWNDVAPVLPVDARSAIEAKFGEVRELLGQITRADADDTLLLQQRKISVGQQLRQANTGRQMNRSYAVNAYAGSGSRMDVSR